MPAFIIAEERNGNGRNVIAFFNTEIRAKKFLGKQYHPALNYRLEPLTEEAWNKICNPLLNKSSYDFLDEYNKKEKED